MLRAPLEMTRSKAPKEGSAAISVTEVIQERNSESESIRVSHRLLSRSSASSFSRARWLALSLYTIRMVG